MLLVRAQRLAADGNRHAMSVAASCTAPPLGVVITPLPAVESVPPVITAPPLSRTVEPSRASIVRQHCEGAAVGARQLQRRAIGRPQRAGVDHPVAFGLISSAVGWLATNQPGIGDRDLVRADEADP